MTFRLLILCPLLFFACATSWAADDEGVSVAKKLAAATVTVRASAPESEPAKAPDVAVFSGVSLGEGLVVTFSSAPEGWRYRLTLPDGTQADGSPRVKDFYSGLTILEISHQKLPSLALADGMPEAGSTLFTAAAAGIEKPVVSRGVLGAVDRKFSDRELPPLLQCDVRTIETSPGAAIVDREGRLLGIIAVNSLPGHGDGWTYAVPVRHVRRVQREYVKGEVKTLRARRPVLGLKLAGKTEDTVEVESVAVGGPAEKAGIRKGDQVLAVQGEKVHSVYQAVGIVLNHQPGDKLELTVQQGEAVKQVSLTLGRGEPQRPGGLVGRASDRGYEIIPVGVDGKPQPRREPRDGVGLLQAEAKGLQSLIESLVKVNESLREELKALRTKTAAMEKELSELKRK
jgi:S1-C subfamily serine protease